MDSDDPSEFGLIFGKPADASVVKTCLATIAEPAAAVRPDGNPQHPPGVWKDADPDSSDSVYHIGSFSDDDCKEANEKRERIAEKNRQRRLRREAKFLLARGKLDAARKIIHVDVVPGKTSDTSWQHCDATASASNLAARESARRSRSC